MKVYFLNLGWLEGDINWMVNLHTYATKNNKEVYSVWSKFPVYSVLIDTGEKRILYDTGQNKSDYDKSNRFPFYYEKGQTIEEQLSILGYKPEDIDTVILSHLHDDHCGNIELFNNAEIFIDKNEYEYALSQNPRGSYKHIKEYHSFEPVLVDQDFELRPGIQIVRLPGHSAGLLGLVLNLKEQTLILTMDAINTKYNFENGYVLASGLYDNNQYFVSMEKISKLQKEYDAKVIYGHDIEQFNVLKHAPNYYE